LPGRISWNGEKVYRILKERIGYKPEEYVVLVAREVSDNPFLLLVSIILSQNTNDKNSIKALKKFIKEIGKTCKDVLSHDTSKIEEVIRAAGLYRQKAKSIVNLATLVCEKGEDFLVKAPLEEVRKSLLKIEGIGPKTIDVFLSIARKAPVFAVDTHARRIATRWGLVRPNATYDEVSQALLKFFGPEKAEEAHRLVIALGRKYCRSKRPRCQECPLREACPYAQR